MKSRLGTAEAALSALLTLGAVWLNWVTATSAGPLWRDEANTVGLATLPTLGDVWANLQYDSFPMLWVLIVRGCAAVFGPSNDVAFRAVGFAVGLGVIAALWYNARVLNRSFPLVSLLLFALCPSLVIWGGSMRAYGFGILLILVTAVLLWRFVQNPIVTRLAVAGIAAVASVHTLYYNSVLLLAFGAGAIAVCIRHRNWKTAGGVVLIGAVAALSIIPYSGVIQDAGNWNALVRMPDYTFGWFLKMVDETLRPGGFWVTILWMEIFALAMAVGLRAVFPRSPSGLSQSQADVILFSLVSLVVGSFGIYIFLDTLSYYTAPWYYLTLLALIAVCVDSVSGAVVRGTWPRAVRLALVLVLGAATIVPATAAVGTRRSNVDIVAARLHGTATAGDVILVNVWYYGVSFSRYYRGPATWMTIPPLGFHRFHRYDLAKQRMKLTDQTMAVSPALQAASAALKRGNRVFIVGDLPFPPANRPPRLLRPRTSPEIAWPEQAYNEQWGSIVGHHLRQHSAKITTIAVSPPGRVSQYENLRLRVVEGWRPTN